MISAQGEDAPAGQHVQIFVAVGIPEIAAFAAHIAFVEANGPQHLDKGGIDVVIVKVVFTPFMLLEPCEKVGMHRVILWHACGSFPPMPGEGAGHYSENSAVCPPPAIVVGFGSRLASR